MSANVVVFPRPKVVGIFALKAKHLNALRYIEGYIAEHGEWPSFMAVQRAVGIGSRLGAVRVVNQLFQLDAIARLGPPNPPDLAASLKEEQ